MAKLVTIPAKLQKQIDVWNRLARTDMSQAVLDAGAVVGKAAIADIQARATSPRWAHCARYLEVGRAPENVVVWIPPTEPESREGFDLEWGSEDRSPEPIMHTTLSRNRRKYSALFSQTLAASMLQPGRRR